MATPIPTPKPAPFALSLDEILMILALGLLLAVTLVYFLRHKRASPRNLRAPAQTTEEAIGAHEPSDQVALRSIDRYENARRILKGKAHVIDGDTIVIKRIKIRLAGIDAPELDQPWGQKSKWEMVKICKGQTITVELNGETSHDRLVGTCYLPDGRDIGAELIKRGLALDWAMFSGGKYRYLEPPGARRKLKALHRRF